MSSARQDHCKNTVVRSAIFVCLATPLIVVPTPLNIAEILVPRKETPAMQTTAIRPTSSPYSTSDAPSSFLERNLRAYRYILAT